MTVIVADYSLVTRKGPITLHSAIVLGSRARCYVHVRSYHRPPERHPALSQLCDLASAELIPYSVQMGGDMTLRLIQPRWPNCVAHHIVCELKRCPCGRP